MFTAALTSVKKFFGINTDVREAPKRPLEGESENEFGEVIFHTTKSQRKKRCLRVDHPLIPDTATDISPVLMQRPWLTWKKENLNPLSKMSSHKNQKQKEVSDGEVTIVEEKAKKGSDPSRPISRCAYGASEQEDDCKILERREARSEVELDLCRPPLTHTSIADFRFVPSSMRLMESDFPHKQKSKYADRLSSFGSHKSLSRKTKYHVKRSPGKRRPTDIFPSRVIKRSVVHKSFLHEEKMKYRQLLQQYSEHYLTPNSKMHFHKVSSLSSSPVEMVARSKWTPLMTKKKQEQIDLSSTADMVSRSKWTPLMTKKKQEIIENIPSDSFSLSLFPAADNSVLEEVFGSKKIDGSDGYPERYQKQKSNSIHVPLIDLSKEGNEEQDIIDRDSDGDSVIMVKEVLSSQAQSNSLEERLKEHDFYNLDWIKAMQKEYEDRAYDAQKNADTTSKHIQELQQRRNKKISLHENVTQRLKLLDLSYPSQYTEIPDEEEEEALVPLTSKMKNIIDDALNKTPQSEVLIEKFHIQITRRDIRTLDRLNWLNDEVINFYMNLLMERSQKNEKYPSVYAFNTFFYPKLSKSGYQSVRRWTKKVDIFKHDLLLVPIHLGMHWCMSVVNLKKKCLSYYDSMLGNNEWCLKTLLEYLEAEHQDKKGSPYNTSIWKLENKKDIPQQMNGSDCGMFACKFADYLSRNARINFDQQHMPYFRRRMIYEIINAKLL